MKQKIKQLPKGWEEKKLGDILDYEQPNKYIVKSPILDKGEIPVLTANKSFIKGYTNEKENIFEDIPAIIFDDFTTDNKFVNFPFKVKSSAMKILKLKNKDNSLKFIYYQMNVKKVNHTTHKRYYLSTYQNLDFLIPSPEIQQKIVQAIETQFSRLDEAIENLKSVKKKIKTYRQSVLKKAFEKKEGWEENKIGNVFKTASGGTPSRGKKEFYSGKIAWLKSGELRDNMQIEDSQEHITEEALKKSSTKLFPPKTVLIAMYGATTGKLGILKKSCSTNQAICAFLPNKNFLPKIIFYYLLLKRKDLILKGKGGAQPNISQTVIKSLSFPKISLSEQQKIVQEIESKFSVIDNIERIVDESLKKAERLRKSILKVAFEGRLVKEKR